MFDSEVNSGFTQMEDINISAQFTEITLLHASTNGYTEVYQAKRYGKWHVLKCLTKKAQKVPMYRTLLEKEFVIAYSLVHPNIVHTLGLEQVDGLGTCIVQEYIDGVVPARLNKQQLIELCQAIGYLHHEGIIHRDIKPDNILIEQQSGKLYLLDLGLADKYDYAVLKGAAGTTNYLAPEQRDGIANIQTDIYALGVVIQQLCSYPSIARRCTHPNPHTRFQSTQEITRLLQIRWGKIIAYVVGTIACIGLLWLYLCQVQGTQRQIDEQQSTTDSLLIYNRQLEEQNRKDSMRITTLIDQVRHLEEQNEQLETDIITERKINGSDLYPILDRTHSAASQR